MDEQLPEGWVWTKLEDICTIVMGQSPPSSEYNDKGEGLPFFQGKAEFTDLYPIVRKWCTFPTKIAEENDILLSVRAPVGPTNLAPSRCSIGRGLAAIRPEEPIAVYYVLYAIRNFQSLLVEVATGTTFEAISGDDIRTFTIPLAPLAEQARIVAAIEQKFKKLDAGIASLQSAKAKIPQYRASLLKAAVEGELTAEWREEHSVEESGEQLLERILDERRVRWEEEQLVKMREKGKVPLHDEWKKEYREPEGPGVENLPELPEGWCWANLGQIASFQNGRSFPSQEYTTAGVKLLRPGNLYADGSVQWTETNTKYLPEIWTERYQDWLISAHELVMNLTAQSLKDEFLGRICITSEDEICLLNQRLARITPFNDVDRRYILYMLKSSVFRRFVDSLNTGSLIQHMFTSQLDTFSFPLPPLAEQAQIIAEVEAQLSEIAKMEEAIGHSLKRAEHERQSILREAFAGRLVEQDTADEPASVLLERIREERRRREEVENGRSKGERRMQMRKRKVSRTDRERIYYTLQGAERALKPEELFTQAGFKVDEQPESVEAFQVELTPLEHAGAIREERPDYNTVVLRAVELPEEKMLELFGTMEDGQEDETEEGSAVEVGEDERGKDVEQARLWDL